MKPPLRNRIKEHRRVRFADLLPHEGNPRMHPPQQRHILERLYEEIGFARSVLAHELPDGRLRLIDGHLRAALTPDDVLDVEVLDVTEKEADVLVLSLDPLSALAGYDADLLAQIRATAEKDSAALQKLWRELADEDRHAVNADETVLEMTDQFLIVIDCDDENHQVDLLRRFRREGLECQARIA